MVFNHVILYECTTINQQLLGAISRAKLLNLAELRNQLATVAIYCFIQEIDVYEVHNMATCMVHKFAMQ